MFIDASVIVKHQLGFKIWDYVQLDSFYPLNGIILYWYKNKKLQLTIRKQRLLFVLICVLSFVDKRKK